jgi:toxin ParE1/3/4
MRLRWSLQARRDLTSIKAYIAERNPAAIERIGAEIVRAARRLEIFPQLGRPAHRVELRLLQVPGLPYLIPYHVTGEVVEVVAVFHERQERPEDWV